MLAIIGYYGYPVVNQSLICGLTGTGESKINKLQELIETFSIRNFQPILKADNHRCVANAQRTLIKIRILLEAIFEAVGKSLQFSHFSLVIFKVNIPLLNECLLGYQ